MKKLFALILAVAMMLSVAAFAESGADVKGTGIELVVYTNSGSGGRDQWLVDRAAQDGYKLTVLEDGAGAIQQRIIGEAANPIGDVVFGLNAIIWNDLIAQDLLVAYDAPSWAAEVDAGLNDPNGFYYAIVKQAILLAWDTAQISEEDEPKDWPDLWENEKYWGKYEYQYKLTGGTTRNVLAGILTRYADPDGELGISEEGWQAVTEYYAHGVPSIEGGETYGHFINADDDVCMGQIWSSGVIAQEAAYGISTHVAVPEVGIPYAVEGVGIINKENDDAKKQEILNFIEWFGSAQIQGEWCEAWGTMPANAIAAEKADPRQVELCSIPAQDIDWALVAANIDAWCEYIQLNCMP